MTTGAFREEGWLGKAVTRNHSPDSGWVAKIGNSHLVWVLAPTFLPDLALGLVILDEANKQILLSANRAEYYAAEIGEKISLSFTVGEFQREMGYHECPNFTMGISTPNSGNPCPTLSTTPPYLDTTNLQFTRSFATRPRTISRDRSVYVTLVPPRTCSIVIFSSGSVTISTGACRWDTCLGNVAFRRRRGGEMDQVCVCGSEKKFSSSDIGVLASR